MSQPCPFCDPAVIKSHSFDETKLFRCFYNHKPILPGHSMIIPKRHIETIIDMSDDELKELALLFRRLSNVLMTAYDCDGIDIALQNGETAGASVAHMHWHIVPRRAGDISGDPSTWMARIIEAERMPDPIPAGEMQSNIGKIKRMMV